MKKLGAFSISFISIALLLSFISCSDDSSSSSPSYYLTAKHSGYSEGNFNAVNVTASETEGVLNVFGYLGQTGQSTFIQLVIQNPQVGTVNIGEGGKGAASFSIYQNNTYNLFIAISGTINIAKNSSSEVEGTFSFTAKNSLNETMNVTDGKFRSKKISI